MPVYNAGRFVASAIESILNQTWRNFELIIVDDGSTDGSWEVISKYKRQYPRKIKSVKLNKNLGRGGEMAGNVAYSYARGELIARMDADDVCLSYRLEKQVEFLTCHPEVAVVGAAAWVINDEGEAVGEKRVATKSRQIYKDYFVFHPMIHPTVMIRREVLGGRKKLYRVDNLTNNDYLTFIELVSKGVKFANLPEKLIYYRIHGDNDSLAFVRRTFVNSLKTRARAVFEFGYRPTFSAVLKVGAQAVLVWLLPERVSFRLYLLARGIIKPSDWLSFSRLPLVSSLKRVWATAKI